MARADETDEREITVRVTDRLSAVSPAAWDACANPASRTASPSDPRTGVDESNSAHETHNPFVSHAFLCALEESGCVSAHAGWLPQHLIVEAANGQIRAAMPCYLKAHSQGEYVFDHGWADAYERAGGRYYPKLQVSVPFTPVTGPRLMVAPGPDAEVGRATLLSAAIELCRRHHASSVHWTFLPKSDADWLGEAGMLLRTDRQFHWSNRGYRSFEDFLSDLSSRKRKAIRRERREATAAGIDIVRLTGADITEAHWDAFFAFYMDTGSRKWGRPYLNRRFFSLIGERMADRIVLIMARRSGRWIAGALSLRGDSALYGRNWGCIEDHPFLHFEVCYYQAIEYAIANGLARVEAGAQGEHKLARGYLPVTTRSAHFIADPGLRRAVADYLLRERAYVDLENAALAAHAPFRRDACDRTD
jgi:predicted N-acyltransferase